MSTPKRHHFVPKMLPNGCIDEDGWLHWCSLEDDEHPVRRARPGELFHKNHRCGTISADGDKDASIETELSKLEGDAGKVIKSIIENARNGQAADLSLEEKRVWYMFLSIQWQRSPELQNVVAGEEGIIAMYYEALAELRKVVPQRGAEIDALDNGAARRRTIKNVRADSVMRFGTQVLPILEQRGMAVVRITKPSKSFVVGSRPVIKLTNPGQADLRDPAVEMWLPISSDLAVGAGDGAGGSLCPDGG